MGWVWVVVMNLLGLGILFFPVIFPADTQLKGQGTALLLVGASILFAVVFATWDWKNNRLVAFASFSTAVFGFLGTSYTLTEQNSSLLIILGAVAFYSVGLGLFFAFPVRFAVTLIRDELSKRDGNGRS